MSSPVASAATSRGCCSARWPCAASRSCSASARDTRTGALAYANAGHNPPLLLRREGEPEWLTAGGLILGILPDSRFEAGHCVLAPGDLLVLYTDGVTEGADAAGELWGEERLLALVRSHAAAPATELCARIVREVRGFEGDQGPADDITVLVARRDPT
jgi:sigma-B regulation protein RsbU (phosphoserine phosphatase)